MAVTNNADISEIESAVEYWANNRLVRIYFKDKSI